MGPIPIARSINPVDAVEFTGFPPSWTQLDAKFPPIRSFLRGRLAKNPMVTRGDSIVDPDLLTLALGVRANVAR